MQDLIELIEDIQLSREKIANLTDQLIEETQSLHYKVDKLIAQNQSLLSKSEPLPTDKQDEVEELDNIPF